MATIQNQSPYVISSDSETEDSGLGKGIKKAGKASNREPIVFVRSLSSSSESSDECTGSVQKPATVSQSPDRNCSICLQQFQNKAFTDNCFHSFCYACIKEWSKVKATCPLCKTEFQSIIHTVKSIDDYQQDYLLPLGSAAFGNIDGQRFRYRTTLSLGRRMITETRRRIDEQMAIFQSYARHERIHSSRFRPDSRLSAISVRKSVYSRGLRARGVQGDQGRSRDISAEFFRSNPAVTHRLVPWLSRELEALVASRDIVEFLLQLILTIIQQVDLGSATIKQTLEPYLLHRTDHFLHEFMTFAKYPFDMNAFDRNVVYESPIFGDVSPIVAPQTPSFERLTPPELHRVAPGPYVPYASGITDIPTSYLNWAPRHSTWDSPTITPGPQPGRLTTGRSVTSISGWDDETPGPSGLTSDPSSLTSDPSRLTSDPSGPTSVPETAAPPPITTVKEEVPELHSPASSSSGDSVIFAGYVKPLHERTPDAFVSLSSGSEDEAPEDNGNTTPPKPSPKRRDRSRSRSRRSRSRSRRSRSRSRRSRSRSRSRSREGRYKNFSRSSRSRSRGRRSRSGSRGRVQRSRPRDRSKGRYQRSSRSKERCQRSRSSSRRRSHSRSRSFSRSRERERLLNKPGGKRKQKTRHLEGSPATSYRGSHRGSTVSSEQRGSSYSTRQPAALRSKDRGHGLSRSRPYRSRSRERSWRSTSKDRPKAKGRPHRSRDRSPVSRERSRHRYRGRTHRSRSSDRRSRSPGRTQQIYRADTQSSQSRDGQNSLARYSGTFVNQETEVNRDERRRSRSSSLEVTYEGRKKHSSSHRKHDDSDVEVTFCKMSSKDSRTSRHHHHKGKRKHKHKKKSKKHKKSKEKEKTTDRKIAELSSSDEESSVGDVECLSTVSVSEKGDATDSERHNQTVSGIDHDSRGRNDTKDIREHQYRQKGGNEDCGENMSFEETYENESDYSGTENDEISRQRTSRVDKMSPKRHDSSNGTNGVKDTSKSLLDPYERRVIERSSEQEMTSQEGQLQQEMMSQEGMLEQEVTSQEGRLQQSIYETHFGTSGSRRIVLAPKRQDQRIVISKNGENS